MNSRPPMERIMRIHDQIKSGAFPKGHDDYEVVIEFDPWATDLVRARRWHSTQEITDLPGGGSRVRMRLNNIEEIERWVLSWGPHATVIRPAALADRVNATATAIVKKYVQPESP